MRRPPSNMNSLKIVADEVKSCQLCPLYKAANNAVPGEGPTHAKLFLIGQAPGKSEDASGHPFVGTSGKFLDEMLASVGIDRRDIFITSAVKHFPPNNRAPHKTEILACGVYLKKQLEIVDPKIIVCLGRSAQFAIEGMPLENKTVLTTVHPSAARRFPKMKAKMKRDFRRLMKLLCEIEN